MKETITVKISAALVFIGLFCMGLYFYSLPKKKIAAEPAIVREDIIAQEEENAVLASSSPAAEASPSERKLPIKMLFFGDLMIDRRAKEKIDAHGMDYLFAKSLLSSSSPIVLRSFDLVSANLEGAVTDGGKHYKPDNLFDFAFSPERIRKLKDYGFNFFSLANNHFSDQGERGIMETRKNLDGMQIPYVGCKDKEVAACSTKILPIRNKKIGFASFSTVYGLLNEREAAERVKELASTTDFVVVNIHWGVEYQHKFNKVQAEIAHRLVDNGASLIIGHHPHVIQGMEIYKNVPIFYSLGNFVFDQYFSADTQHSLGVRIVLEDKTASYRLIPLESLQSQLMFSEGKACQSAINSFLGWSILDASYSGQISENASLRLDHP